MTITTGSISSPSLNIESAADASTSSGSLPAPNALSAASALSANLQNSLPEATSSGLNGLLADTLAATLKRLDVRLDAVSWPESWPAASSKPDSPATSGTTTESASPDAGEAASTSRTGTAATDAADFGAFDPEAPTTLAPGAYTLGYAAQPDSSQAGASGAGGQAVIRVYSGDTWQDVLQRLARAEGSASMAMLSRLVPVSHLGMRLPAKDDGGDIPSNNSSLNTATWDSGGLGEAAPMSMAGPAARLADALGDVLASYNEVGASLARNAQALKPGAAADWAGVAGSRTLALAAVGILGAGSPSASSSSSEFSGPSASSASFGPVWLSEESFLTALWSDPAAVQTTLSGPDGFLSALKGRTDAALGAGGAALLASSAASPLSSPPSSSMSSSTLAPSDASAGPDFLAAPIGLRTEAEVEQGGKVLDIYDAGKDFSLDGLALGGAGALVRRQG